MVPSLATFFFQVKGSQKAPHLKEAVTARPAVSWDLGLPISMD